VSFKAEDAARNELHLQIVFITGSKFKDEAGIECAIHDTVECKWRHLNFFEHHCFLHCKVPRITTSQGKVRTVNVPWVRAQSGFTLLFEAFALALIEREMPVARVAQILGVNPQRVWSVFDQWVGKARTNDDPSAIKRFGVDETSSKKAQSYVTIGVDLDAARVIYATEGVTSA
jgi:transposase